MRLVFFLRRKRDLIYDKGFKFLLTAKMRDFLLWPTISSCSIKSSSEEVLLVRLTVGGDCVGICMGSGRARLVEYVGATGLGKWMGSGCAWMSGCVGRGGFRLGVGWLGK